MLAADEVGGSPRLLGPAHPGLLAHHERAHEVGARDGQVAEHLVSAPAEDVLGQPELGVAPWGQAPQEAGRAQIVQKPRQIGVEAWVDVLAEGLHVEAGGRDRVQVAQSPGALGDVVDPDGRLDGEDLPTSRVAGGPRPSNAQQAPTCLADQPGEAGLADAEARAQLGRRAGAGGGERGEQSERVVHG